VSYLENIRSQHDRYISELARHSNEVSIYGLLCMAASGWIDMIHYTYIHTYKHTYKDNTTIYTMQ